MPPTAADRAAPPAHRPHDDRVARFAGRRGLLNAAGATAGLAALLAVVFRNTFVSGDAAYALLWGRQALGGRLPDYGGGPVPHPLVNLVDIPLAALGGGAEVAVSALAYLSLAGLIVMSFELARSWFGLPVAIVAVVLLATRPSIVLSGVISYTDTLFALLCLGALLSLTRDRLDLRAPLLLLAFAGLIRPEAWPFSVLLVALHLRGGVRRPGRLAVAAMALAAPALWALSDLVVTGDPLYSLFSSGATIQGRGGGGSVEAASRIAPVSRRLSETTGKAELLAGLLGAGLVGWRLGRRPHVALVALGLFLAGVVAEAMLGVPIVGRYLYAPGVLLLVLAAVPLGARGLFPRRRWEQGAWLLVAAACAVLLLAFVPERLTAIWRGRAALATLQQGRDDAHALLAARPPAPSCGPIAVPTLRLVPVVRLWLERDDGSVVLSQLDRPEAGTYLVPVDPGVKREFIIEQLLAPDDPRQRLSGPPEDFRQTARNRSWALYEHCR